MHLNTKSARPAAMSRRRLTWLVSAGALALLLGMSGWNGYWPAPASSLAAPPDSTGDNGPRGFAALVKKVKPAVVAVRVRIDEAANDDQVHEDMPAASQGSPLDRFLRRYGLESHDNPEQHRILLGLGSGFLISADGYVVTNNHVVNNADSVKVTTDGGQTYTAKVIGTDEKTDLALIKIDGKTDFPFVSFEDEQPEVGDWVLAVGNPFGLGGTVTAGIVSARGRDIGEGPYDDFIQIDAPINKGNSGGPAFDMSGKVAGVNTAIYSPSGGSVGIGFDIPSTTAKLVIDQLREHGKVTRGWLGVATQPVTKGIAESLGMKDAEGALVDEPEKNSPAAKAGIEAGDVITAVNGKPVKDARDLARQIAAAQPGSSAQITILSKGQQKTVSVTLGSMPDAREARAEARQSDDTGGPRLGLALAPASRVPGAGHDGVVITSVDPDGRAAEQGLQPGDIILDIAGKPVGSAGDVRKALEDAKAEGKQALLLRVKTSQSQSTHFVALPIG